MSTSRSRTACRTACFGTAETERFEDVTEMAGVGVLDRTSQSLFADIDNDGDEDLDPPARIGPMLFTNDGKGVSPGPPMPFNSRRRCRAH